MWCVGFYVKENLVYSTRLDLNITKEKFFKFLFIDDKFKNKKITFGCIYRTPRNDTVSHSSLLSILNNTLILIKRKTLIDCENPQILDFVDQMFSNVFALLSIRLQEFYKIMQRFWIIYGTILWPA